MNPILGLAWRFAALAGLTLGLAAAPLGGPAPPWWAPALGLALLALWRPSAGQGRAGSISWLALLALAVSGIGLAIGAARLDAIDAGALDLPRGTAVRAQGTIAAVPRRSAGEVRVRADTPDGRILLFAPEPVGDLPTGSGFRATGTIRDPADWENGYLRRLGITDVLLTSRIERTGRSRGGLPGLLDGVRSRAEEALGRGTEAASAALLRGFVLGQDDRIDPATVDEFKASGLAHLLAVSGQNIVLLAILAGAVLAVVGVPRRARLAWILLAIAVYVPIAGGGSSIQRAGIMGAAGVVAALSDRPRSRWYALLLAATATLALNPRAHGDVGWQLSFAAVLGILACAAPIRRTLGESTTGLRAALAEGAALTVAATLATAPLLAHHFGTAAVLSLPANLIALPAVAPVMWLGMLSAALGQLAWIPVEPVTWLAGLFAGAIAQVAAWFSAPSWALAELELPGVPSLLAIYAAVAVLATVTIRSRARRRGLGRRRSAALAAAGVACAVALAHGSAGAGDAGPRPGELTVRMLDVGQGDAILLQPHGDDPVLFDAGPPGGAVSERLDEIGVGRLSAMVATHPSLDHLGGVGEVFDGVDAGRFVFARVDPRTLSVARASEARLTRVSAGDRLRIGRLRLEVLWPPASALRHARTLGAAGAGDPNGLALVVLARWGGFELLLTADAEAELAPVDPGSIDVLKVAHHGSEDTGLPALLERADPRLALISVGADNRYGHPTLPTIEALAEAGVTTMRTDLDGEITLDVGESAFDVR